MRLTRRMLLAGGAAAGCGLCGGAGLAQWPGGARRGRELPTDFGGCALSHEEAAQFARQIRFRQSLDEDGPIDTFFAEAVASAEVEFEVTPAFAFYNDSDGRNAFATRYAIFGGNRADGAVAFGEQMLMEQQRSAGPAFSTALFAIVGHEFGHIRQYKEGITFRKPDSELQADFLAGWLVGKEARLGPERGIPLHVPTAAAALYAIGDYQTESADHHGTPEQRQAALLAGVELGSTGAGLRVAFARSDAFVRSLLGR